MFFPLEHDLWTTPLPPLHQKMYRIFFSIKDKKSIAKKICLFVPAA